jgi:RNA polymerase sigma-70 factor, ECF subfamily
VRKNDTSPFALLPIGFDQAGRNWEPGAPGTNALKASTPRVENPAPTIYPLKTALPSTRESLPDAAPQGVLTADVVTADVVPSSRGEAILFEEVVNRYHGKVFRLIYRYIGDYDESCDLTQDTFVRAYSAWHEFRGEAQVYTWLHRIAINTCLNHQKKAQRRRRVEAGSLDHRAGEHEEGQGGNWSGFEARDEYPLPLQVLESQELRVRLHEVLCELPDNYRTVIILRDMEGLTYEEIARITESTLETIKSRLFRARNALRRLMEPYLTASSADPERFTEPMMEKDKTRAHKTRSVTLLAPARA